jgi:hypothetical protein
MTTLIATFVLIMLGLGLGLVLLVLGVVAVLVAVIETVPWLLVLAGIVLLVLAQRRQSRARLTTPVGRAAARSAAPSIPSQPVEPQPVAPEPVARPLRELPIDVQVKVDQVRRKADLLLGYADRFPPFSHDLHLVQETAAEYLPRTIETYLALPGEDDPPVAGAGQTALQELKDQLTLLDSKLDEIALNLQQQDLERLLANRRFLEERFRTEEEALSPVS